MSEKEILDYFELCDFPMLDNGYYYHVDQTMSILKNETDWAIILQTIAFHNHQLDVHGITTFVYTYGSFIDYENTFTDDSFYYKVENHECEAFLEENELFTSYLNPDAKFIKVNDTLIPLEHRVEEYEKYGIELETEGKIRPWEYMRFICPKYSHLFWVSRDELKSKIPLDLKEELTIRNWEHPDNIETVLSDMDSFKEIATSLANNSSFIENKIQTIHSNTHWHNWPDGGSL